MWISRSDLTIGHSVLALGHSSRISLHNRNIPVTFPSFPKGTFAGNNLL